MGIADHMRPKLCWNVTSEMVACFKLVSIILPFDGESFRPIRLERHQAAIKAGCKHKIDPNGSNDFLIN